MIAEVIISEMWVCLLYHTEPLGLYSITHGRNFGGVNILLIIKYTIVCHYYKLGCNDILLTKMLFQYHNTINLHIYQIWIYYFNNFLSFQCIPITNQSLLYMTTVIF